MKLTSIQKKALELLANSDLKEKFYWSGGTLLAHYYLGHRYSLDLDFFTDQDFVFDEVNQFIQTVKTQIGFGKVSSKKIFDRWGFQLGNKSKVLKIEFVYYNHQRKTLGKREKYLGVWVDSLKDLAANKTVAYFDRNEAKDLFDLYFLIKKGGFTPNKLLSLASKKFGVEFNEANFWSESFKGLNLLKEVKPLMTQSTRQKKEALLDKIQTYFKESSKRYLERKVK